MGALLVGAGIGSAAGVLYSYNTGFLTPDVFALTMIVTALVVVIVGGSGTTYGSILGAGLFVLVPEILRGAADYRLLIFGLVLAAVMLWLPEGLWPLLGRAWKRVRP
jgi:branched-chain amino acid transport system permease protein